MRHGCITAVFDTQPQAEHAIDELRGRGVTDARPSIMMRRTEAAGGGGGGTAVAVGALFGLAAGEEQVRVVLVRHGGRIINGG